MNFPQRSRGRDRFYRLLQHGGLFSWLALVQPVHAAPIITPHDTVPDFCESPTKTSVGSGNWSSGSTWSGGSAPGDGDIVVINPGHTVTFDASGTPTLNCIGIKGTLNFRTDINTSLKAATIMVYNVGRLIVGTTGNPVNAGVKAEIIIANRSLNLGSDPGQYGTGLLVWGEITMAGAAKNPTFLRASTEPRAGHTSVTLTQSPSGWRVGDKLVFPDTRQLSNGEYWHNYQPRWETPTITAISGNQITLSPPLAFDHIGARDAAGNLEYLPHIGNLTRNVVVRSENPQGTRGHVWLTYRANVDIRYAQFEELGRTSNAPLDPVSNHMGRYALHIHHVYGPPNPGNTGHQFKLIGNSIFNTTKWIVTIHDSHYGLIQDNVGVNGEGGGFVTEDGSESYNEFRHNFCVGVRGDGDPRAEDGRDGSGFWFMGFNHIVRDNVASASVGLGQAIVAGAGFNYTRHSAGTDVYVRIPLFRGADVAQGSEGVDYMRKDLAKMPILEFSDNEAYGATAAGLVVWNLGATNWDGGYDAGESLIKNFTVWHVWEEGFYSYPNKHMTFDGFIFRSIPGHYSMGWQTGDYFMKNIIIRNANIQGAWNGIDLGGDAEGEVLIENSYIRSTKNNIVIPTFYTPGTKIDAGPRRVTIRNVKFDAAPGNNTVNLFMQYKTGEHGNIRQKNEVFVYAYNQNNTDNFRLYFNEQNPSAIMTATDPLGGDSGLYSTLGCPQANLTNQQCWNTHGMATAGIDPATICGNPTTRPEITGFLCPLDGGTPPPPPSSSRCDVNNNGVTNVVDVQLCTNQVLGTSPCTADINQDGECSVIDIQRVVNAALGGQCVSP
jgi:hypothetical protein